MAPLFKILLSPLIASLILPANARTLYDTTGFDGITYTGHNHIRDICNSKAFRFNLNNIEESGVVQNYTEFSIHSDLRKHLKKSKQSELNYIGSELLGFQDYTCSFTQGKCSREPNCEDVAKFRGIKQRGTKPSQDLIEEVRKRYFLWQIIEHQVGYYHAQANAYEQARDSIQDIISKLTENFATQPNSTNADSCQWEKAVFTGIYYASVSAIATASILFPQGPAIVAMGLTGGQLGTIFGNIIFASGSLLYNIGLYESSLPADPTDMESIHTAVETGRCARYMGKFADQDQKTDGELHVLIGRIFDDARTNMINIMKEIFGGQHFYQNNQSALAHQLNTYSWSLPLEFGHDRLQAQFAHVIKEEVTKKIIGDIWTSAQCYIKCLHVDIDRAAPATTFDPPILPFDPQGHPVGAKNTNIELATFYPEIELAKRAQNISGSVPEGVKPTLQCQFACLEQQSHARPFWPPGLQKLKPSDRDTPWDPHSLFTDAVVNHFYDTGNLIGKLYVPDFQLPNFRLPVCVSNNMPIQDIESFNNGHEYNWYNPGDWFGNFQTHFPLHCGGWDASETNRFLNSMPIGPDTPNFQAGSLDPFFKKSLSYEATLYHETPITSYLTLCNAGWRMPRMHKDKVTWENSYQRGPDEMCERLAGEVHDMSEIEANLWFCLGPTMNQTIHDTEINVDIWTEAKHEDLCKNFKKKYYESWSDYESQFKGWQENSYPFRWTPKRPSAIQQSNAFSNTSWPATLEIPREARANDTDIMNPEVFLDATKPSELQLLPQSTRD